MVKAEGETLQNYLEKNKYEPQSVIRYGLQALKLIETLHRLGYVHGDITPSNFVVGRKDNHKLFLIDFNTSFRYIHNFKHV